MKDLNKFYIRIYTPSKSFDVVEMCSDKNHLNNVIQEKIFKNNTYTKMSDENGDPVYIKTKEIIAIEAHLLPLYQSQ